MALGKSYLFISSFISLSWVFLFLQLSLFVWTKLEEGEEALAAHQVSWDSEAHGIWEQPETFGRTLFLVHLL